jgi:hypothetical protein
MKKLIFCNVALLSLLKLGLAIVARELTFEHCQTHYQKPNNDTEETHILEEGNVI